MSTPKPLREDAFVIASIADIIHDVLGMDCPDDGDGRVGCFDAARDIADWLDKNPAHVREQDELRKQVRG